MVFRLLQWGNCGRFTAGFNRRSFKIFLFFIHFNYVSEKRRGRVSIWGDFCVKYVIGVHGNLGFANVASAIECLL